MKKVDFPHSIAAWDRYKAFHVGVSPSGLTAVNQFNFRPLILFDTGELIAHSHTRRPGWRGDYGHVGVSLLTTQDLDLYTPEGERVPKAWLNTGGQQCLLVDWSSGRAVGLGWGGKPAIPQRFNGARAFIPEPGAVPVGHPITVRRPFRKYSTPEEREYVDEYIKVVKVAMTLTEHDATKGPIYWGGGINPERILSCDDWRQLENYEQLSLFHYGANKRRTHTVDYLLTSPDGAPYKA